jgi:hypothetical protein
VTDASPRRDDWKRELAATHDCVPLERFGEALTAQERDHVAHCVRCESEMALWEEFRDATPSADEGGAVQWIVADLGRRGVGSAAPAGRPSIGQAARVWWASWAALLRPQALAAVAGALLAVVSIGYVLQDREPSIGDAPAGEVYRSARIDVAGPTGDLSTPPTGFHWVSVPGADSYDVQVLEVDRTILWRTSTREPRVDVPPAVAARFVPGKTILWHVTARRRDGTAMAQSGTERFRVRVTAPPQRE